MAAGLQTEPDDRKVIGLLLFVIRCGASPELVLTKRFSQGVAIHLDA
jgi:hypothetical protein